jgi:hypothetical protein
VGGDLEAPERLEPSGPRPRGLRWLGYRSPVAQGVAVALVLTGLLLLFTTVGPLVALLAGALYGLAWAGLVRWRAARDG